MSSRNFLLIPFGLLCGNAVAQMSFRNIVAEEIMLRQHAMEIASVTELVAEERMTMLRSLYHIPLKQEKKIASYIRECERRKFVYNYIYRDSVRLRLFGKNEIDSIYSDSVNIILIPVKGNVISGENISLALSLSSLLRLDDTQREYLMDIALSIARRIHKEPRADFWNEEMDVLRKILSAGQLNTFFMNKNSERITGALDAGWRRIVAARLTSQVDSAKEFPRAYIYYHEQFKIMDIFRNFGTPRKKNLAELQKHKPAMVRIVDELIRREKEQKRGNAVGNEFVW